LATALLRRIDWKELCPREQPCAEIRVDPQLWRASAIGVERVPGKELMLLNAGDLPFKTSMPPFVLASARFAPGDSAATVVVAVHTDSLRSPRASNVAAVVYSPVHPLGLIVVARGTRVEGRWQIEWIVATPY
jgi:hypothetical protein